MWPPVLTPSRNGAPPMPGAVDVVQALGYPDAVPGMAAIEVTGPAGIGQVSGGGGVDVVRAARGVEHLGNALADGGHQHVAHPRRGAAGSGIGAVEDGALRHLDGDRPHLAVAPRHVPEQRVGERQGDMRHGAREGGVVVRVGLRAGALQIELQLVTLLGHGAVELLGHGRARLAVQGGDILPGNPGAVRQRAQLGPGLGLRILDHAPAGRLDKIGAKLLHQPKVAIGADVVAGDHGLHVQTHVLRSTAHAGEGTEHVFAELVLLDDLEAADADALVKDLQRASPQHAAGVRGVGAGGGPGDQLALVEDGLDDHHVVGVGACHVGIVEEELVAVVEPPATPRSTPSCS